MTLYQIIKALQAADGNLAKAAIMDAHKDNVLFKYYMRAAYDVSLSYYMTKVPKVDPAGLATVDADFILWIISDLAGRRITGKAAAAALKQNLAAMDAEGQELVGYIIKRSIGASVGDKMVLTAWPKLYFIPPYMRCSSMDAKIKAHYATLPYFYVQTKRDGSFAYLQRREKDSRAITRQGNVYPQWFSDMMSQGMPVGKVLAGEMEVYKDGKLMSRKEGNGVLNSAMQSNNASEFTAYDFRYIAWLVIEEAEFEVGRSDTPYELQLGQLKDILPGCGKISMIQNHTVTAVVDANAIHTDHTKRGLEGTVWKDPNGLWRDSSGGTKDAVKNKVVFEAEYEITGSYEGEGKAAGMLGGIGIKTKCGKLVNNVGSGFSDKQRKELWAIRDELPGKIVTCEANDIIDASGKDTVSLSLGIFIEIRTDKTEADTLERAYEQLESAKYGRT